MARYILIDNGSGYVWGDSADLHGKIFTGSPIEFAQALDESIGEHGRSYEEVSRHTLERDDTGYHVYKADVGGSDAVTVIYDGQDREVIRAVQDSCEYVTAILCTATGTT